MSPITIIVGAQWGDEGKGKITDVFAKDADYVVRFHGGNNAGHTLMVGNETYKLHLIPSGVLYPEATSIIGTGVVLDPAVLLEEIDQLKQRGLTLCLKISSRAHVIMPYHIALDEALSSFQGELGAGSTKRGIAPVCADKMYRHGLRLGDLLEPELFQKKLHLAYAFNTGILKNFFNKEFSKTETEIYNTHLEYGQALAPYITDTDLELWQAYRAGKRLLFEGAQGMSLDVDHGVYPHTTSTNCVSHAAGIGGGLGYNGAVRVVGVVKAYVSRVGTSPFITELLPGEAEQLRKKGQEYGTTTGRPRRVGWLDLVQVRQAVRLSGITELALTKADILSGYPTVPVCTAYEINGQKVMEMPASLSGLQRAKPIYTSVPGWSQTSDAALRNFVNLIERETNCRVKILSYGPQRAETQIYD